MTRVFGRHQGCLFFGGLLFLLTGAPVAQAVENQNGSVPVGHSQNSGDPRISLPNLIEELESANPEIKAARQRWGAAKAVVPQVQTLPDPRLQLGYQRMPMVPPVVEGAMYGFGEEIPFPGKLSLKGEVAQRDADRIEQEFHAIRLRLIAGLKEAYFSLRVVHKSIEIVGRNKGLLMQFEKTAKARYTVGQPSSNVRTGRHPRRPSVVLTNQPMSGELRRNLP